MWFMQKQRLNIQIDMKIKLIVLLLLTLFSIKMSSQEILEFKNCFGERVMQDYLAGYKNQQTSLKNTNFWFEDTDIRHMATSYLNSYADSITTDTIFFIHVKSAWGDDALEIIPGDTLFGIRLIGYQLFDAYKTPFLNLYSEIYRDDLCKWDTAHISKPTENAVFDGPHYFLVRLIYNQGLLISTEFCHHGSKLEYYCLWYDQEKLLRIGTKQ